MQKGIKRRASDEAAEALPQPRPGAKDASAGHTTGHTFEYGGTIVRSDEILLFERVATNTLYPVSSEYIERMRALAAAATPP